MGFLRKMTRTQLSFLYINHSATWHWKSQNRFDSGVTLRFAGITHHIYPKGFHFYSNCYRDGSTRVAFIAAVVSLSETSPRSPPGSAQGRRKTAVGLFRGRKLLRCPSDSKRELAPRLAIGISCKQKIGTNSSERFPLKQFVCRLNVKLSGQGIVPTLLS
jgi:hypothetical protein